uniref:RGS domain-containing protein n=1 Tax=Mola mola TaxID=94237 RepID=A0A3Q4BRT5_MOLML
METMLQALSVDSSAGSYFTIFCEQSGKQLWENAMTFWTDLQHYRELFYQDGLDPYRVQREAQLLYSTHLLGSAGRSIGVDEGIGREVYERMMPPFEELFDGAEEHVLNVLLEPWTLLVHRDEESFQKVTLPPCLSESTGELVETRCTKIHSKHLTLPFLNLSVSYPLGWFLRHRREIGHFMSFLQEIHLSCWLDLDQYRTTPQEDEAVRQERSSHILTQYLNRKYFFGPAGPATAQQQTDILRLEGGLESLSNRLVMEIQDIVNSHIERTWLPLFLSAAVVSPPLNANNALRRPRQAQGLWMSSSQEILLLRRVLLNPVTSVQFQHFVSLKGQFLENDVRFWLEVQRYKDLCHSHSDEVTIQQKISTIINCFISSSMPPTVQIDIPPEQARRIVEKRREPDPYIFREAQMSVFGELLRFWPEFQQLRSNVGLLDVFEKKMSNVVLGKRTFKLDCCVSLISHIYDENWNSIVDFPLSF